MALDEAQANRLSETLGEYATATRTNAFGDTQLIVTAEAFRDRSDDEREEMVSFLLADPNLDYVEMLAPGETIEASPLDDPLWPEALAKGAEPAGPVFPSDLDADLSTPVVVTFYSLRGGVGRSTALAHTARELAARGRSVVVVDMDFEAPGLASLFGVEELVANGAGLPGILLDLERGEDVDLTEQLIRLSQTDELYLLPAGRPSAEYARVLSLLAPDIWYRETANPLWRLIDGLGDTSIAPDVILVDSRTGLNPLSAPLLFDASDLAVIGFFPHPQAESGTRALVRALLASHTRRSDVAHSFAPEPRFLVSPIPAGSSELRARYERRALDWITEWLAEANEARAEADILIAEDLCHIVPYRESAATSDRIGTATDEREPYGGLADWVDALIPSAPALPLGGQQGPDKLRILDGLAFSTGTSESQERFTEAFVPTELIQRALDPKAPLVLGRKGTGKTAVFRWLVETDSEAAVIVTSPDAFRSRAPWTLGPDGFDSLDAAGDADWRGVWLVLIAIALWQNLEQGQIERVPSELRPAMTPAAERSSELATVGAVRAVLQISDAALLLSDWISRMGSAVETRRLLLFDGLDTGFGSSVEQRVRRTRAISALLPLALERGDQTPGIAFKILLREDIWRGLDFQNKSHYFGRSVTLAWQDQVDYLRTVVKQAVLNSDFRSLISDRVTTRRPIEQWSSEEVLLAWNSLVGERMKGGKTTFTRNWVWNRLADANGDHSPRSLLQLFFAAKNWEAEEERESPYERSIIRPRALMQSLHSVSDEALVALREEFAELAPILSALRGIGRTPLDASDLDTVRELIELAREVGLLEVYEGNEDEVRRYRVPDLFRLGLGMTRMGQI